MSLVYSEKLPIGWQAGDFKLLGVDDKEYSLNDFKDKKGLLIVFSCNHCPYAQSAWTSLAELYQQYGKDVSIVVINANDAEMYPEDSFSKMKELAEEYQFRFLYLYDQTQEIAKKYQAQCTPDPYLFKNDNRVFKLYYHGRINDNWQNPTDVREKSLQKAIENMLTGEASPKEQLPSMGCSIKWKN